jgi:hypothetical protein
LRVFENKVLRRCKRKEVTGDWREVHSEKLHNLYSSANIIRLIISRIMRWVGHIASMEEMSNIDHLEDTDIDGKIILDWILEK